MLTKTRLFGFIILFYAGVHLALILLAFLGYRLISHNIHSGFLIACLLWLLLIIGSINILFDKRWGKWVVLGSLLISLILDIVNIAHPNEFHTNMPVIINTVFVIWFSYIFFLRKQSQAKEYTDSEKHGYDIVYGSYAITLFMLLAGVFLISKWAQGLPLNNIFISPLVSLYAFDIAALMSIALSCMVFSQIKYRFIFLSALTGIAFYYYNYWNFSVSLTQPVDDVMKTLIGLVNLIIVFTYGTILAVLSGWWFFFERRRFVPPAEVEARTGYKKYWYDAAYLLPAIPLVIFFFFINNQLYNHVLVYVLVIMILLIGILQFFIMRERNTNRIKLRVLAIFNIPIALIGIVIPQESSIYDGIYPGLAEFSSSLTPLIIDAYLLLFLGFAIHWFFFERHKIQEKTPV